MATFLQEVLREASHQRLTRSFQNWVVGNLRIERIASDTFLYGRVGKVQRNSIEHFEGDEFAEVSLETSASVAFVFHEQSELTCVEDKTNLTAQSALTRMTYIFNKAPQALRNSLKLQFYPIEDKEQELAKLRRLARVTSFVAKLREPNPYTSPQYRDWWQHVNGDSDAKKVDLSWSNAEGALNLEDASPIMRAIEMAADAYGTWAATGFDAHGHRRTLDSGKKVVRFTAPFKDAMGTLVSVADFVRNLLREREDLESKE